MIRVEHIYKSFDKKVVLSDIDAVFEEGKVNLIIGKSGSGKTVLLKSLIGLHPIDSGRILYDDRDITSMDTKQVKKIREELGVVFQGGALFDSLSVLENVKFPLNLFSHMSEKEKVERALFCLNRVNLDNVEKFYPAEISGGMKKRVAIARAIVMQPKYLFCDEPNSGLDPLTSIVIDNLLSELTHEYQMTTIINTHDMNSVFEIGENILFIHEGKKEWEGNNVEIMNTTNKALNEFLFTSKFNQLIKEKWKGCEESTPKDKV
ncbi:ATP-binding cassette domain-containing protein [uncultured Sanguibacteroides sp.]|uniref:ABC transporter ATP-binding protein n=1 Tax=uncultured Sanguibacteroides sp. TaxID=1635151 RepID=UPI0025FDB2AF|nr:ATP-binding cassette domain-containing protein [uncultured Sanguibacteroides sp.]